VRKLSTLLLPGLPSAIAHIHILSTPFGFPALLHRIVALMHELEKSLHTIKGKNSRMEQLRAELASSCQEMQKAKEEKNRVMSYKWMMEEKTDRWCFKHTGNY